MRKHLRPINSCIAVLFLAVAAEATPVQFDTHSYNFALAGGGGGESGVLNSNLTVTFCDNFNNEIYIGHDYSAYLSTLTTGSDLSQTRFGSNMSWRAISISDGGPNDAADSAILNDAGALARYQMAAFLVFQYQPGKGSNAGNNGIQAAIWDIMDPSSSPAAPQYANADKALEQAAEWYANPSSNRSFLSDFLIVSDATMSSGGVGNPLSGGFQEQLTLGALDYAGLMCPVPEPRAAVWMLIGLSILARLRRPALAMKDLSRRGCFHGTYQTDTPIVSVLALGTRTSTH